MGGVRNLLAQAIWGCSLCWLGRRRINPVRAQACLIIFDLISPLFCTAIGTELEQPGYLHCLVEGDHCTQVLPPMAYRSIVYPICQWNTQRHGILPKLCGQCYAPLPEALLSQYNYPYAAVQQTNGLRYTGGQLQYPRSPQRNQRGFSLQQGSPTPLAAARCRRAPN